MNECFIPYRNKHTKDDVIFFGSGPTLNRYTHINGIYKVGVNECIFKDLDLDYYFIGDPSDKSGYYDKRNEHEVYQPNIAKFYRKATNRNDSGIPKGGNGLYYDVTSRINKGGRFYDDLEDGMGFGLSVSMEVLQFLIYCGFKNIYLIGHDCDYTKGTFRGERKGRSNCQQLLNAWDKFYEWFKKNIKHVNIYSVNPIGLKLFPEVRIEEIKGVLK